MQGQSMKRVVVLVEHRYGYFREVLRGVRTYARQGHPWVLHTVDISDEGLERLLATRPDGLVGHTGGPGRHRLIQACGIPTVHAVRPMQDDGAPVLASDDVAVGRLAAEHLLGMGLRRFAFAGEPDYPHARLRFEGFDSVLHKQRAGLRLDAFRRPAPPAREYGQGEGEADFAAWMAGLEYPVGLFAVNDTWATAMADRCHEIGLRIPDEVALLGVDNDDLVCESASPPLSSVQTAGQRIGYEAARLLDGLMAGRCPGTGAPVLVPPVQVVARESTNALPTASAPVVAAVRFIRGQSFRPLSVDEVSAAAHVSRRLLELRFRSELGRSVLDEIHHAQVDRARHLLVETDLPMGAVAEAAGFAGATRMGIVFRKQTGVVPSTYRSRIRIGP